MKLTLNGIKEHEAWENAGIQLPGYDVEKISAKAKEAPVWVHFGIGNIFRVFIGGIADGLLEDEILDRGITCVETFDYDVVDKIYEPYDNLGLNVILHGDGTREYKVLGALAEAVKAQSSDLEQWNRLKEIFTSKSLQMASFTITEKGYALHKADGTWFPFVQADIQNGPDKATGAMAVLVAMLYERYKAGEYPIALVSMDNCSQNGAKLRESVLTMTEEWNQTGLYRQHCLQSIPDQLPLLTVHPEPSQVQCSEIPVPVQCNHPRKIHPAEDLLCNFSHILVSVPSRLHTVPVLQYSHSAYFYLLFSI